MLKKWQRIGVIPALAVLMGAGLAISVSAFAEEDDAGKKPPKLFAADSELQITLSGPWREIRKNIKEDALYPVQFKVSGEGLDELSFDAEVAPRGVSRRFRTCDFPPLKVHFDKKAMKGSIFRGNKSLKLVTYCDTNSRYEQYNIKEFLAYRIYNQLTDFSFRVRPARITYVDSGKGDRPVTRFSFFIEDIDDVAKRNDLKKLEIPSIPYRELDSANSSIMSLFQFMIGNLDWAATSGPKEDSCCHNTRLAGAGNEATPKFAIPYDFDSSGFVDAHYAAPPKQLKMRNIRQRLYRGFCKDNDQLSETIALFNSRKTDIFNLLESQSQLGERDRNQASRYLEDFYQVINQPDDREKQIIDKCRGKP